MKLYTLGDMHFSTSRPWDTEMFNAFISWFEKVDFGNREECELIQLGDVVERASNLGDTLELVTRLFKIATKKFKTIYVIGGNHDHKNVFGDSQYATQFLRYLGEDAESIQTIYEETLFSTKNGWSILALPFRRVEGKVLDTYYSEDLPKEFYNTEVDLLCGHVAIKEKGSFYGGIDIKKFKFKNVAMGHIHTRNGEYKDYYTGSILPFKIDEAQTASPRIIKCFSRDGKSPDIQIPEFIIFKKLQFGEDPVISREEKNLIHIFTVTNCKNIQQAKIQYPDLYIRGIEKLENKVDTKTGELLEQFISPRDALDSMIKENKLVLKRKTINLLKSLLKE